MKNPKVFFLSLIALIGVVLGILVHWSFIIISVILMLINQHELMKTRSKK